MTRSADSWADDPGLTPWLDDAGPAQVPPAPVVPLRRPTAVASDRTARPGLLRPPPRRPVPPVMVGGPPTVVAPPLTAPAAPAAADGYLRDGGAARPVPRRGARGWLFALSGGRLNAGTSTRELAEQELIGRIRTPLTGWHTVTVASTKGGVGKTTTSALLGLTLAEHRPDRVVALDANPDAGNLADRLLGHSATASLRQLLDHDDPDLPASFTEISRFVHDAGRLQVLASDQDAAMSEAFDRDEYRRVLALLVRFFTVVVTDSGTGLVHSAMAGALETTRTLVVTGAPTIDAAGHIDRTLDSLSAHGFDELVRDAIVVLSCDRQARSVDPVALKAHFARRCRAVVAIPRDPHLAEGGRIRLEALRPATRAAARELAALVGDAFAWDFPATAGIDTAGGR